MLTKFTKEEYEEASCIGCFFIVYVSPIIRSREVRFLNRISIRSVFDPPPPPDELPHREARAAAPVRDLPCHRKGVCGRRVERTADNRKRRRSHRPSS
jgi:hypothetical protein